MPYNVTLEIDSVNGTYTSAEILGVDEIDYSIPVVYTVYMVNFFPVKYHSIATWQCGDSSSHVMSYTIPKQCQYWTQPDSNTMYTTSGSKDNNYRTTEYRPDSVIQTDMICLSEFYQFNNDSIRSDTLFEKNGTAFNFQMNSSIPYWQCSYYFEQKHGKEIAHYHINEVSGKCVNADTNLKKYEGEWKFGKKKGKWYFYDIYGELLRIEYYNKGVRKKIKNKTNT